MFKLAFTLAFALSLAAQTPTAVLDKPDCTISGTTLAASATVPSTSGFSNSGTACQYWAITWFVPSAASASLTFQGAPDNAGTPGSWGNYQTVSGGSVVTGANPSTTSTNTLINIAGFAPWVRVLNSGSVPITFVAFGYKGNAGTTSGGGGGGGGSGCVGTSGTPCIVAGPAAVGASPSGAPVYVSGLDGAGNIISPIFCTLSSVISISSSGNNQIIAASGGKKIRICNISLTPSSGSQNIQITTGTGSNCGTGTANLTGLYSGVVALALDFGTSPLVGPTSAALCVNLSGATSTGGLIQYAQF